MNQEPIRSKSVALCFRGIEQRPEEVESMVGFAASAIGHRGAPVRPGMTTRLKRSFVLYSLELANDCRLDEMIPALLARLGGVDRLYKVCEQVSPEFLEFDITLPIRNSTEQEGGSLLPSTLADLVRLKASLSFQFL